MKGYAFSLRRSLPVACAGTAALVLAATAIAAVSKTIVGTARSDVLRGTSAADTLYGRSGDDRLYGYGGADRLLGGPGKDRLYAGAGRDVVVCGTGRDIAFVELQDRVASDCEVVRRPGAGPNVLSNGLLAPGEYVSAVSQPRVRLTIGSGWRVAAIPRPEEFTLQRAFTDSLSFGRLGGSVDDVVGRLSTLGTVTAAPVSVIVGGKPGQRFDLVGPTTVDTHFDGAFFLAASDSSRVWVLDRGGRTVTIIAKAPTAEFPVYTDFVQQVLATLVFEP